MKKLTTKQLKKIDQTIKLLTKLFGEVDNFAEKNSLPKISTKVERKTKFLLARKKKFDKINKQ